MIRTYTFVVAAGVALAVGLLAPATAAAEQVNYSGIHPVAGAADGEFCYIEFPHVHVYAPDTVDVLYRVTDGHHHFVGDPVGLGYEGPQHTYYGHHPVVVDLTVHLGTGEPATEFCYMDGPHFHSYAPPPDLTFTVKGDAYWYIGKFPPAYHKHRKRLARINAVYQPIVYERPVVVVDVPPVGYVGPVVEVRARTPAVHVDQPHAALEVHVPVPSVDIHVGLPGVVVETHRHKKHKKYKKHKKHKKYKKHKKKHRHH